MNIRLHIERLVLEGISFEPHARNRLRAAVESELARLIQVGGLSGSMREAMSVPTLRGETIAQRAADPTRFGKQIATAVYRSLR